MFSNVGFKTNPQNFHLLVSSAERGWGEEIELKFLFLIFKKTTPTTKISRKETSESSEFKHICTFQKAKQITWLYPLKINPIPTAPSQNTNP